MAYRLAASQIGWAPEEQDAALAILQGAGFAGLEIAPTMVAGQAPYEAPERAAELAVLVKREYGLAVCSLQSIWYGQAGSIFGPERDSLLEYTKGAIRFAESCGAHNLVFGCPKNRVLPEGESGDAPIPFFKQLGDYAAAHSTVLALEANPPLYGTNFMNTTPQAFAMARAVQSAGCRVNLDVGTLVVNGEPVESLSGLVPYINHVHVSEPGLAPLQKRPLHAQLARLLKAEGYGGYVSIEMGRQPLEELRRAVNYVAEVFAC